ncbi:hypothetical protein KP78_06150 [Jeotgalibacillus soli]|uniref:Uncharacterized protein n=1 Tax=Jeotgalibacillus soli TaxID=889306 RepID=A0A0C2S9I4_9BACL|nr:hypothetical protein KP78_06150 [Jeotgalibacillus soli]
MNISTGLKTDYGKGFSHPVVLVAVKFKSFIKVILPNKL